MVTSHKLTNYKHIINICAVIVVIFRIQFWNWLLVVYMFKLASYISYSELSLGN